MITMIQEKNNDNRCLNTINMWKK